MFSSPPPSRALRPTFSTPLHKPKADIQIFILQKYSWQKKKPRLLEKKDKTDWLWDSFRTVLISDSTPTQESRRRYVHINHL